MAQFGGLYRATVTNSIDPEARGRLEIRLADPAAAPVWAEGCGPIGPWQFESDPPPPSPGTAVWVMFEGGDPSLPVVVVGRVRQANEADPAGPAPRLASLHFPGGKLTIDARDPPGAAISIRLESGASVALSGQGLELDNGKGARITLRGPAVTINEGALEIV